MGALAMIGLLFLDLCLRVPEIGNSHAYVRVCVCVDAWIFVYGSPPPLIHIFWPLQPTQAGLAQHLHTRGRAPLNAHAAPKFLGHLWFGDSKH